MSKRDLSIYGAPYIFIHLSILGKGLHHRPSFAPHQSRLTATCPRGWAGAPDALSCHVVLSLRRSSAS